MLVRICKTSTISFTPFKRLRTNTILLWIGYQRPVESAPIFKILLSLEWHKHEYRLTEVKSRTQGFRPRPRTQKNPRPRTAFPRTDTLEAKDRNARGRGKERRTQAQVLSKIKKSLHKSFLGNLQKKRFPKNFSSAPQNFNNSKNSAVLEPRTGQFSKTWGLEAKAKDLTFEAKDFKMCPRGRPRGQSRPRGLHLCRLVYFKPPLITLQAHY